MAERVGRYEVHGAIGRGGMATVYLARLVAGGLSRPVALKRLHPSVAERGRGRAMFADEARLAMRVVHPNVVSVIDILEEGDDLHLVMDLVIGDTLAALLRRSGRPAPPRIVSAIMVGMLHGLHAAHEATDERGAPLRLVHRDVSPQNVMVGVDGVARVLDFGVAKALGRVQETTENGQVKGKLAYVAPEQLRAAEVDARADVFAAGVVLWEALTARPLFASDTVAGTVAAVLSLPIPAPSSLAALTPEVDAVVLRALERAPHARFASALDFADALAAALPAAPVREVAAWVEQVAAELLAERRAAVVAMESGAVRANAPAAQLGDDEVPSELGDATPAPRAAPPPAT
ncbi:MAG: Protein kinase, partial [Labilithrix sp.]|nr:Protein kinase [Labilithrix sp.]